MATETLIISHEQLVALGLRKRFLMACVRTPANPKNWLQGMCLGKQIIANATVRYEFLLWGQVHLEAQCVVDVVIHANSLA